MEKEPRNTMKCPVCNVWTQVLHTDVQPNGSVKRRRRCANEHRFNTFETPDTLYLGSASSETTQDAPAEAPAEIEHIETTSADTAGREFT